MKNTGEGGECKDAGIFFIYILQNIDDIFGGMTMREGTGGGREIKVMKECLDTENVNNREKYLLHTNYFIIILAIYISFFNPGHSYIINILSQHFRELLLTAQIFIFGLWIWKAEKSSKVFPIYFQSRIGESTPWRQWLLFLLQLGPLKFFP